MVPLEESAQKNRSLRRRSMRSGTTSYNETKLSNIQQQQVPQNQKEKEELLKPIQTRSSSKSTNNNNNNNNSSSSTVQSQANNHTKRKSSAKPKPKPKPKQPKVKPYQIIPQDFVAEYRKTHGDYDCCMGRGTLFARMSCNLRFKKLLIPFRNMYLSTSDTLLKTTCVQLIYDKVTAKGEFLEILQHNGQTPTLLATVPVARAKEKIMQTLRERKWHPPKPQMGVWNDWKHEAILWFRMRADFCDQHAQSIYHAHATRIQKALLQCQKMHHRQKTPEWASIFMTHWFDKNPHSTQQQKYVQQLIREDANDTALRTLPETTITYPRPSIKGNNAWFEDEQWGEQQDDNTVDTEETPSTRPRRSARRQRSSRKKYQEEENSDNSDDNDDSDNSDEDGTDGDNEEEEETPRKSRIQKAQASWASFTKKASKASTKAKAPTQPSSSDDDSSAASEEEEEEDTVDSDHNNDEDDNESPPSPTTTTGRPQRAAALVARAITKAVADNSPIRPSSKRSIDAQKSSHSSNNNNHKKKQVRSSHHIQQGRDAHGRFLRQPSSNTDKSTTNSKRPATLSLKEPPKKLRRTVPSASSYLPSRRSLAKAASVKPKPSIIPKHALMQMESESPTRRQYSGATSSGSPLPPAEPRKASSKVFVIQQSALPFSSPSAIREALRIQRDMEQTQRMESTVLDGMVIQAYSHRPIHASSNTATVGNHASKAVDRMTTPSRATNGTTTTAASSSMVTPSPKIQKLTPTQIAKATKKLERRRKWLQTLGSNGTIIF